MIQMTYRRYVTCTPYMSYAKTQIGAVAVTPNWTTTPEMILKKGFEEHSSFYLSIHFRTIFWLN